MSARTTRFRLLRAAFATVLLAIPTRVAPQVQQTPPDVIARFHINNGSYLADVGKYLEALEELDTAYNYSTAADIKAEALSSKAVLLSAFLDNPQSALLQYDTIVQNLSGTTSYGPAIFQSAMLRYDNGDAANARPLFQRYLREFPSGPQATTSEYMMGKIPAPVVAPVPVPAPGPGPKPPPLAPPKAEPITGRTIRVAMAAASSLAVSSAQGLSIDGKTSGTGATFTTARLSGDTVTVESKGPIVVAGKTYRGKILLIPEGAMVRPVNEIAIEEYLYSVVPSEVYASWPVEALKAQAVAARTYAYYMAAHPRSAGKFDLYNDVRSQAYEGFAKENARTTAAIDATRGQVLMYNGRLVLAYFTSNNGGSSADPEFIFGAAYPYLKPVKDTVSKQEPPYGQWTRRFSLAAVEEALQKSGYAVSGIKRISPVKTCPSGRLLDVAIEYNGGRITLNTRTQFRRALNDNIRPILAPENLPETLISILIFGNMLEMSGGGWGHGVGMSQYGARGMAQNGSSYKEILSKYYLGVELKTLS